MAVFGIDCDQVLVDSGSYWLKWLNELTKQNHTFESLGYPYNAGDIFTEELKERGIEPHDFWKHHQCYDGMEAIDYARQGLQRINDMGHTVIIVSHTMGNHYASKLSFLERNFGGLFDDYIAAIKKHYVSSVDVMIDDRMKYLKEFKDNTTKVLYHTPFDQCSPQKPDVYLKDWKTFLQLPDEEIESWIK